jgi:Arm DNA-binding domain
MAGKLKPLEVARQVTPGKYPDGDGLYLIVAGPTSRNWSYRYWIKGKERWHGLGSLQDLSLKDARIKRDAARQEVRAGVDIVQTKRLAREGARAEATVAAASTFKECAERYIKDNEAKWSKKHAAQWPSSLKQYAYPTIGDLRIAEILPARGFGVPSEYRMSEPSRALS